MPRPAPAVHRTTVLLNFLAARAGESFTLSRLAAELGFNKTTTQTMLAELAAARYVVLDAASRTYRLGPAVIPLGAAAASDARTALAAAEPYLMSVRDDYEVSCVVTTLLGGDIVVIGRYDHTRVPPTSMRLDDVVPAIPPVGRAFVAWADPAAVNAWLDRLGDTASVQLRERYEQMLTGIRRRGYLLNRETGTYARLGELAARLRSVRVPDELEAIIDSLQDAVAVQGNELTTANLRSVSVPVFDATGRVLMTLTGVNFPPDITRDALGQQVHALLRAAAEVTTALGGRHPGPDPLRDSARPPRISDGDFDELFPHASVPV